MAITKETVKRVFQAIQDNPGMSVRQIALKLNLSRFSVDLILAGKSRVQRKGESPPKAGDPEAPLLVDPYRCRGCGKLVTYMPCVFCKVNSDVQNSSSLLGSLLRDSISRWDREQRHLAREASDNGNSG